MEGKKDGAMQTFGADTLISVSLVMVTVAGHPSHACLGIVVKVTLGRRTNNTILGLSGTEYVGECIASLLSRVGTVRRQMLSPKVSGFV